MITMEYNIVFCTDANYVQHLCVSLLSLLKNNKNLNFNIYIINCDIDKSNFEKINKISSTHRCKIINLQIDEEKFNDLKMSPHLSKATYFRLSIPELIDLDKVLYLDVDIIVTGSIIELYSIELDDYYVGAVIDYTVETLEDQYFNRLKMKESSHYFNAGIMLINVSKWKSNHLKDKVIDYTEKYPERIHYADQCGLNAVIDGDWKILDIKFNLQSFFFSKKNIVRQNTFLNNSILAAKQSPIIIHFSGPDKPWQIRDSHPYKMLYWKYLMLTPYRYYIPADFTLFNIIRSITPLFIKEYLYNFRK